MKTVEEIIVEKEFDQLTQEELVIVSELAENEQEYKAMRSLFAQMELEVLPASEFVASGATKQSLDNIFMSKHPVIAQDWKKEEELKAAGKIVPLYNRNWFRAAAVLLLFSGTAYLYFNNSEISTLSDTKENKPSLAIQTPNAVNINRETNSTQLLGSKSKSVENKNLVSNDPIAAIADKSNDVATFSTAGNSVSFKDFGMNADLNPNGNGSNTFAEASSTSAEDMDVNLADDESINSGSEVSTTDMLDWIQTVY